MVEQSNSGSNFEGMSVKQLIFGGKPSFEELVCRTKDVLGWSNQSIAIQGRYDVGAGPISHKYMLDLNGELEWNTYVDIVLGSQFKSLEVVASKLDRTDCRDDSFDLNRTLFYDEPNYEAFDDEGDMKSQSVKSLTVEEVIESQGMGVDVNMQKKEAVDANEGRSQESDRVEINVELQKEEAVEANKSSRLESEGVEVNVELQKEEAIEVNEARSQAVPIVGIMLMMIMKWQMDQWGEVEKSVQRMLN